MQDLRLAENFPNVVPSDARIDKFPPVGNVYRPIFNI